MKVMFPETIKEFLLQFANLYHQYKIQTQILKKTKYSIFSTLEYYKETKLIQLSYNDKPGDLLPPMHIQDIKNAPDILSGLHPMDVNSINDLYYLAKDKISKLIYDDKIIRVITENGEYFEYDVNEDYNHEDLGFKRVDFLIGYMQAEK